MLMSEFKLACGSGATYFLTSLLDHPDRTDEHLDAHALRRASAVRPCPRRWPSAPPAKGISIVRMYGSTEHPSITGSYHTDPEPLQRLYTDGRPLEGVEIRLLDDHRTTGRGRASPVRSGPADRTAAWGTPIRR